MKARGADKQALLQGNLNKFHCVVGVKAKFLKIVELFLSFI